MKINPICLDNCLLLMQLYEFQYVSPAVLYSKTKYKSTFENNKMEYKIINKFYYRFPLLKTNVT